MYFFTPLCKHITSFLFGEMVVSKVHQPYNNFFTLTLSKSNHGSCSLVPHKSMLKLKNLPLFFIVLYKNCLSTPNIFATILPLLMFLETAILQTICRAFTPSLFKAPNPVIQTIREVFNEVDPFNCLHRTQQFVKHQKLESLELPSTLTKIFSSTACFEGSSHA